jgi:hypothetical protein
MNPKRNLFQVKSVKSTPENHLMTLKEKNIYFDQKLYSRFSPKTFSVWSPFNEEDTDRKRFTQIFCQMVKNKEKDFNPSQLNLSLK